MNTRKIYERCKGRIPRNNNFIRKKKKNKYRYKPSINAVKKKKRKRNEKNLTKVSRRFHDFGGANGARYNNNKRLINVDGLFRARRSDLISYLCP